jgi:hypothetical protein
MKTPIIYHACTGADRVEPANVECVDEKDNGNYSFFANGSFRSNVAGRSNVKPDSIVQVVRIHS